MHFKIILWGVDEATKHFMRTVARSLMILKLIYLTKWSLYKLYIGSFQQALHTSQPVGRIHWDEGKRVSWATPPRATRTSPTSRTSAGSRDATSDTSIGSRGSTSSNNATRGSSTGVCWRRRSTEDILYGSRCLLLPRAGLPLRVPLQEMRVRWTSGTKLMHFDWPLSSDYCMLLSIYARNEYKCLYVTLIGIS